MRKTGGPVIRGILAVVFLILALFCLYKAFWFAGGFFFPDPGPFPGEAGTLVFAAFFLLFSGPFLGIAVVLGMPLLSDNPKWRGADTSN